MALTLQEISEISHRDAQLAEALRKIQAAVNARAAVAGAAGPAGATGATGAAGPAGAAGLLNVVKLDKLGLTANLAQTTIATPGSDGFYRLDVWIIETVAAATSSTLPQSSVLYTDADTGTADSVFGVTPTDVSNAVPAIQQASIMFYAKAGQVIQVQTAGYASSPAGMKYNARFRLEGPF